MDETQITTKTNVIAKGRFIAVAAELFRQIKLSMIMYGFYIIHHLNLFLSQLLKNKKQTMKFLRVGELYLDLEFK